MVTLCWYLEENKDYNTLVSRNFNSYEELERFVYKGLEEDIMLIYPLDNKKSIYILDRDAILVKY